MTILQHPSSDPKPVLTGVVRPPTAAEAAFDRIHNESVAQNRLHLAEPIDVVRMLVEEHGASRILSLVTLVATQRGEVL